jgi:acetoacetate decarboxylase
MGLPGQLKKAQFGYSMPVDSPLYEPFPIYYRDITLLLYAYVTDASAAAALLPEGLEVADVPIAQLLFAEYPFSTVGTYLEVAQTIACTYHGKPAVYAVRLHVTNAMAMSAGREIGGFPKKLGSIELSTKGSMHFAQLQSPPGLTLCTGQAAPIRPVTGVVPLSLDYISLRTFPNPADVNNPALAQLIGTQWVLETGEMWEARGSANFTGASEIDPYHKLPILGEIPASVAQATGILPCAIFKGNMAIKQVTVLANL